MSLRQAAELVGITHSRLREWERGIDNHSGRPVVPPFDAVRRLARLYGVSASGLLRLAGYGPEPGLPAEEQQVLELLRTLSATERSHLIQELLARYTHAPNPQDEQDGDGGLRGGG